MDILPERGMVLQIRETITRRPRRNNTAAFNPDYGKKNYSLLMIDDFALTYSQKDLDRIALTLNSRLGVMLGFQTPQKVLLVNAQTRC